MTEEDEEFIVGNEQEKNVMSRPSKKRRKNSMEYVSKWANNGPLVNKFLGDEYYKDIFKVTINDKQVFNK